MENRTAQSPGGCPSIQEDVWSFPFSEQDWQQTPRPVQAFLVALVKRIEELERRLNQDSSNSSRPPSSDSPFKKKARKEKGRKSGARKGHQGHRQVMLGIYKILKYRL